MKTTKETRLIRKNLRKFGLNDICVDVKASKADMSKAGLSIQPKYEVERDMVVVARDVRLTQVCGTPKRIWVVARLGIEGLPETLDVPSVGSVQCMRTQVFRNGQRLGYIDSDQQFHFEQGCTTRESLGWYITTDLGREKELDLNLDDLVAIIKDKVVNQRGTTDGLMATFGRGMTSRFGDTWGMHCVVYPVAYREYLNRTYVPPPALG